MTRLICPRRHSSARTLRARASRVHSRSVCCPAVTKRVSSRLKNRTQYVSPDEPIDAGDPQIASPRATSHTTIALSSSPPSDTRYRDSGENASSRMSALCSTRRCRSVRVLKSHTQMSAFVESTRRCPLATNRPHLETAMQLTAAECPCRNSCCLATPSSRTTTVAPRGYRMCRSSGCSTSPERTEPVKPIERSSSSSLTRDAAMKNK
eukprot:Amastigsp_a345032_16.p3 type:complete len:208 gc:universal Amastigsp_a345032_16:643-20(-)